ncbi:MAG: GDP-mannose 4,6-dehydratase [Chloroflexi bacterium]|nr:GDP-mannose 4,6-dehydratase [Chloroflexota bacterium]
MRALVTGATGFVGSHLVETLLRRGDDVYALDRRAQGRQDNRGVHLFGADLLDAGAVDSVVQEARPAAVYHLAAQSSTADSLADPWATIETNLRGQINLFDAVLQSGCESRILVACSSDEYGAVAPEDVPTDERAPLRPTSPYAVSKVGQDAIAFQYFAQYGLKTIRVRAFSHTGPGHDERFVLPSFAKQVAEIEAGTMEPRLRVGNLDVERDFTDVRDMVEAYCLALEKGVPGDVYNVGQGVAIALRSVVSDLVALSRVPIDIVVDSARLRPSDVPRQQANTAKFRALTGWKPRIPWSATLFDTLEFWRARVRATTHTAVS